MLLSWSRVNNPSEEANYDSDAHNHPQKWGTGRESRRLYQIRQADETRTDGGNDNAFIFPFSNA